MRLYSGNGKPFIYVAFPSDRKDNVLSVLEILNKEKIEFWYAGSFNTKEHKRLQASFALLLFITKEYANSEVFHNIVDDAVKLNKNILCVYLEEVEKTSWMRIQLSSQQDLSISSIDDVFINKLKSSFIFKNMKVTKTQKKFQRNKAIFLIFIPIIVALIAFFTTIKPYMTELEESTKQQSIKHWGLTEGDLESIYEIHLVGDMNFDSKVYAEYDGDGILFNQYGLVMDRRFHVVNKGYTSSGSLENKDLEIIKYMPNLKNLDIEGQQISDISLLFDTNIEQLRLCCNPITSLEGIQKMKNLKELAISSTDITDISPVYELENLESLWINDTQISDISGLVNNKKLKELNISGSDVKTIPPFNNVEDVRFIAEDIYLSDYSFLDNVKSIFELVVLNIDANSLLPHIEGKPIYNLSIEEISSNDDFEKINVLPSTSILLINPLLETFDGIEKLEGVTRIDISYFDNRLPKSLDLTALTKLNSLEDLAINKEMKDLAETQLANRKFRIEYRD